MLRKLNLKSYELDNSYKKIGENIKRNIQKKFPTKKEQAESNWISCCSAQY